MVLRCLRSPQPDTAAPEEICCPLKGDANVFTAQRLRYLHGSMFFGRIDDTSNQSRLCTAMQQCFFRDAAVVY